MFNYLRKSLWTLPWIVLLPLLAGAADILLFNKGGINFSRQQERSVFSGGDVETGAVEEWELDVKDYGELLDAQDYGGLVEGVVTGELLAPAAAAFSISANLLVLILLMAAAGVNLLLLLILPGAIQPTNTAAKTVQFYIGFFVNSALTLGVPLVLKALEKYFYMAGGYIGVLFALFALSYLAPFIIGSRFVSPAVKDAFWFWQRH